MAKAQQFSAEASAAISNSRNDAAMLNAVHAAISATDAVCVALSGRRSGDPDHQRAADLLQEVGGKSKGIAGHVRQLRMLFAKKNVVEYESRQASAKEATEAVQGAERFVSWARQTLEAAQL
ncbi:MAG: HEPN domain-containing protein [Actinobacteria bacterium]|nr:HEPN domain-containing protein [Actinomycetota bacterium]